MSIIGYSSWVHGDNCRIDVFNHNSHNQLHILVLIKQQIKHNVLLYTM